MEYKLWSITFCNFRRILYLLYFSGILVSSLLFCMDVELRLLHCRNKIGWGSSRRGWWGRNFWPDRQKLRESCRKFPYNEKLNYFYSSPNIISFFLSRTSSTPSLQVYRCTWSHSLTQKARHRDLYVTARNIHERQISTPPAGFEPVIPVRVWPQTHALDHAATRIGSI